MKHLHRTVWVNKNAHALYKYIGCISYITIGVGIVVWVIFKILYHEDFGHEGFWIAVETLIKNIPILIYLRKKALQDYSEDYLIPQWFKDKFYNYMKSKAELRAVILFLFIPLFYVVPLPFGTCVIFLYILPVSLLITVYFGIKWIKQGSDESIQ